MLPRKRFEIGPTDFLHGMIGCLFGGDRQALRERLEERWTAGAELAVDGAPSRGFACLSVRSGLDLYLAARRFPAGSEILMSGATVPDMARVVRAHDLVPVAVDFDLDQLLPTADEVAARRSERSRALVVAHLFGAVAPMDDLAALCRDHRLDLVEDCAQAYRGAGYRGDPRATLSLFSFGPIKSATALAGAVATVRDAALWDEMRRREDAWPVASDAAHLRRLVKYAGLALLTTRPAYTLLAWAARLGGRDLDTWVGRSARSFPGADLLAQIRRRPGPALLALLARRLADPAEALYQRRADAGRALAAAVERRVAVPGGGARHHTFWVFPVLADDPDALVRRLRRAGFDATRRATLAPLKGATPRLDAAFERLVYLPFDARFSNRDLDRMAKVVAEGGIDPGIELGG